MSDSIHQLLATIRAILPFLTPHDVDVQDADDAQVIAERVKQLVREGGPR